MRERLAHALRAARRRGLSDAEAARVLGYDLDSLRRMAVLELADELPVIAVTDYVLPRVYGDGRLPDPMAYPNLDPRTLAEQDARTRQIAAALTSATARPSAR